jgi:predicted flavoprotein YhiN
MTSMTESHKAEIIVIGGGAAGLMAAAAASQTFRNAGRSESVVILEKMQRPGRKIMITGKGRCNFSNVKPWNEFSSHIHPKANFLKASFHNLTPERLMDFFSQNGMDSVVERGDRVFPTSRLSS